MSTEKKSHAKPPTEGDRPLPSIAVIGDIVGLKQLPQAERSHVQRQLEELLNRINKRYAKAIGARFLVTLGDEFQGVLKHHGWRVKDFTLARPPEGQDEFVVAPAEVELP